MAHFNLTEIESVNFNNSVTYLTFEISKNVCRV